MKFEWIVLHAKAHVEIRSGANVGLQHFSSRLERNAAVSYIPFQGATWNAPNSLVRIRDKIASVFSSVGAATSLHRQSSSNKIVYQNCFSGYFAAVRTILFTLVALHGGCACVILHVRNGNLAKAQSWRLYQRFLKRHAGQVVFAAQFESLAQKFEDAGFVSYVLRNFIEKPRLVRENGRGEVPTFCFFGTRFASKGVVDFVAAADAVAQDRSIRIYIAGPSASLQVEAELDTIMRGRPDFHDLSTIDRDHVEAIMSESHYIVMPTRYTAESVPRVLIEAISVGCVPIATDHAGIREQLGEVATICGVDELEAVLRTAVEEIDNGIWATRSETVKSYFSEKFSPELLDQFVNSIEVRFS